MQRWVLHIDMDAFYASCEQLTRPTLRGRPVLVGGVSGRGVVAGASYEARKLGAKSAMPMFMAKKMIGFRGVVVAPRFPIYKTASRRVFKILNEVAGVVEQVSVDEGFMEPPELQGASPEEVNGWAQELRARIREETGLPSSVGAGAGKQFAKIGSGLAKPDGVFVAPSDKHEEIFHPLKVGELWGVGPVTAQKLAQIGVETIGDLAHLSEKEIDITLGATVGRPLWMMARGVDNREVAPRAIAKQISAEHTYPKDLRTKDEVDAAIDRAARGAHKRLLVDGRGARTISVKLRMADFHIESRSITLPYATSEFDTLKASAMSLARYPDELGPIRLVGVGFSGLEVARQDVLFPELDLKVRRVEKEKDDDFEVGVRSVSSTESTEEHTEDPLATMTSYQGRFRVTQDVEHPEFGHGWVQGMGHGKVTVRFETRTTLKSAVKTFDIDDNELTAASPLGSLDWDLSEEEIAYGETSEKK